MAENEGPDRRRGLLHPEQVTPVCLTRKLADVIDGVDISGRAVGERLCLGNDEARLLIAEGWAQPVSEDQRRRSDLHRDAAAHSYPPDDHKRCV